MSSNDEFFTIKSELQTEIRKKGSRFIGTAAPAPTVEQAEQIIKRVSKQYYNATHNCFAYRIKLASQVFTRQNDAGEPSGTAGAPILNVIIGQNLYNIVVVVSRYFGGIKLGKGGLIRAYTDCTKSILEQATFIKKYNLTSITFTIPYHVTGNVMRAIAQMKGHIKSSVYDQQLDLTVELRQSLADSFKNLIIEITSGKAHFE